MKIYQQVTDVNGVNHSFVFDFELIFFDRQKYTWIQQWINDWWWLSIVFACFYIIAVFIGREWMKRKAEKYELREALIFWNTILTIFSFWGAYRCIPEFIQALNQHDFRYSLCDSTFKQGITGLW